MPVQYICTRSLTDRTKASDAFNAGSIPVGCIFCGINVRNQTNTHTKRPVRPQMNLPHRAFFVV